MKKLLGIVVLSLLFCGNTFAEIFKYDCTNSDYDYVKWEVNFNTNTFSEEASSGGKKWDKSYGKITSYNQTELFSEFKVKKKTYLSKFNYATDQTFESLTNGYVGKFNCVYDKERLDKFLKAKFSPNEIETPEKKKPKPSPDDNKIVAAGSGSGFIVSKDGTVITNYHVIEGCELNKVTYKGSQLEAKVLSIDKVNDIAILKTNINSDTAFAVSNEDVSLLEDVVVAGFPLGKQISSAIKTHKGVVTALAGAGDNYSFFQTDAAINQGNSGGPIINQKGNVIGIAVQTWVEEGVQGVHFGIKSSTLKTFASANGLKFLAPNNRDLSNKELGKLITENTVYVECHMTIAKIKKMIAEAENKKAFFKDYQ